MKTVGAIGFTMLAVLLSACRRAPQESSAKEESSPLILTAQLPLPGVHGRFDHFSFDPAEPGRIFISALGNNSVEVINTVEGTAVHSIAGIPEPQGVAFAIGLNKLFVASSWSLLVRVERATVLKPVSIIGRASEQMPALAMFSIQN
jgi:hypothetical protein